MSVKHGIATFGSDQHNRCAALLSMAQQGWQSYQTNAANSERMAGVERQHLIGETLGADGQPVRTRVMNAQQARQWLAQNSGGGALKFDDHVQTVDEVVQLRRRPLNGINDLISNGLTRTASIDEMAVRHHDINGAGDASRGMNPSRRDANELDYSPVLTPLPITWWDFKVPWRQRGYEYKNNDLRREGMRKMDESLNKMLFLGDSNISLTIANVQTEVYGYVNHPATTVTTISDWTDPANHANIVPEALALIGQMFSGQATADNLMMYVGNDLWVNPLQDDYNPNKNSNTVIQRLRDIAAIRDIKPCEYLPGNAILFVEMDSRTVELAIASDIVTIPWMDVKPMQDAMATMMAAMVPIIKNDRNSTGGILYATAV